MKKIIIICSLILVSANFLWGGDTARFINLGFSGNGSYFMFAQHGYKADTGQVYSDLYIVDVQRNVFTPGGVHHGEYEIMLEPGQSSDGALFTLLEDTTNQRKRYAISFLEKGRPLYIRMPAEGEETELENSLQFRDFETKNKYTVELVQSTNGEGQNLDSAFYIDLTIEYRNGVSKTMKIGHPEYRRNGIKEYNINRILLSPDENSLVFIVSKTDVDLNIRYMIETVRIQ